MNSLNTIPNEIILYILDNFECTSDLKIARAICKKWRNSVDYFMKAKCKLFLADYTVHTMWKFIKFSAAHILREINFKEFQKFKK